MPRSVKTLTPKPNTKVAADTVIIHAEDPPAIAATRPTKPTTMSCVPHFPHPYARAHAREVLNLWNLAGPRSDPMGRWTTWCRRCS